MCIFRYNSLLSAQNLFYEIARIWVNLTIKKGKFIVFDRKKVIRTRCDLDYKIVADIKEAIGKYYESNK